MSYSATAYLVLIASPSDVKRERAQITELLHAWSDVHGVARNIIFQPVRWETHAVPEMGSRPQAIVNKQLTDKCDILIGVFWGRIGTPTGEAESGSVEEIKEFIGAGKRVLLYFSSKPIPQPIDQTQYIRLQEFKDWCRSEGLVSEYDSDESLNQQITLALSRLAEELGPRTMYEAAVDAVIAGAETDTSEEQVRRFIDRFKSAIRRFEAEWLVERDSEPYTIDDGKSIASAFCSQLLDLRSDIVSGGEVVTIMDDCARRLKSMQRVHMVADGGMTFRKFWSDGVEVIEELKKLVDRISPHKDPSEGIEKE